MSQMGGTNTGRKKAYGTSKKKRGVTSNPADCTGPKKGMKGGKAC